MNSFAKRKITAVAVSLMLVVAIVVTGVLCAPNLHKSNNTDVNVSQVDERLTAYNAYSGTYSVGRINYTGDTYEGEGDNRHKTADGNTAMVRIQDGINGADGVNILYPKDIYLDNTETLESAGYYYHMLFAFEQRGIDGGETLIIWYNVFGKYTTAADMSKVSEDAKTFNSIFGSSYKIANRYDDLGKNATINTTDSRGARFSDKAGAGETRAYNGAIEINRKRSDPRITLAMEGTPDKLGDYIYNADQYTGSDPYTNSNVVLFERHYKSRSGDGANTVLGSWFYKDVTAFTTASESSMDWIRAPKDSNCTMSGDSAAECAAVSDVPATSEIKIGIHVYNKTNLLKAMYKLEDSYNALKTLAVNAQDAYDLINTDVKDANGNITKMCAKTMLGTREVTAADVEALTNEMNNFVFNVTRPRMSLDETYDSTTKTNYAWIYGDEARGGGEKYMLNGVWSNYTADNAKFLNVNIDWQIANELNAADIKSASRTATDKDTYEKNAYVLDAGSYTITFKLKSQSETGLDHRVQWATENANFDADTSKTTLTIARAGMQVDPTKVANNVADRVYTGAARTYTMTLSDTAITLAGKMSHTDVQYEISKKDLGEAINNAWNSCGKEVTFTEVGTHTIFYRVQAENHRAFVNRYTVKITPATLSVAFKTDGIVATYGDPVVSSEKMIDDGVTTISGLSSVSSKDDLKKVITLMLVNDDAEVTDNLTPAGHYAVDIKAYGAIAASDLQVDSDEKLAFTTNNSITSWRQRVTVNLSNDESAYYIAKKEIGVVWEGLLTHIYDGNGGKRPTANVNVEDAVEGGEKLVDNTGNPLYTVEILTGTAAGVSEGKAGILEIDGERYEVALNAGGNAIFAGTYKISIRLRTNSSYTISEDKRVVEFTIQRRNLTVQVLDQSTVYAHAMNEARDSGADEVKEIYQGAMFNSNSGSNAVYQLAEGTTLAGTGVAGNIFKVDIIDVPMTGSLQDGDAFYKVGTYPGALVAKLREEGDMTSAGGTLNLDRVRSYNLTSINGTFIVEEAQITSTIPQMSKTFDGTEQAFVVDVDEIKLFGYESIHKFDENDNPITIEYSEDGTSKWSTTPISIRDVMYTNDGNVTFKTIYYRISAANHTMTGVLDFNAYIRRLNLDVTIKDINNVNHVVYYGDNIPNSAGLVEKLDINYATRKSDNAENDDDDKDFTQISIDGKLQFYIAKGSTKIDPSNPESRKSGAGTYSLYLEAVNAQEKLSNYNIRYYGKDATGSYILNANNERITNANLNVFRISKRPIVIDWRMSGNGWKDGMNFVYNDDAPIVQPYVNAYRENKTYDATSVGEGTQDGYAAGLVENYVQGDSIELVEQRLSGSTVGDYTTARATLSAQKDIDNYVLVNPIATYSIIQREVKINIKDRTAVYGSAKTTVTLGRLGRLDSLDANWTYNENTEYRFVEGSDHYTNWILSSSALAGGDGEHRGVGEYDIVLAVATNGSAIADNYKLVVYRQRLDGTTVEESTFAKAAKFIITEAELSLARNEFNFDADNADEVCAISIDDIKNIVRVIGDTDAEREAERDSLTITMYEAKLYDGENPDAFDANASTVNEINIDAVGRYYVWISISGHNYTDINITVDVNYLTNWVSIKLSGYIEANYGDAVYTSNQLFTNLKVASIIGVWDTDAQNYYQDTEEGREAAWTAVRTRGYFTLYVDGLKNTNSKVGTYSVYMQVASNVVDYNGDELNFRFVGEEVGKGATSNVDVYHVIPRPIYIEWGDLNEIYGEHGENSNSHKNFEIMNVLPGDNITKDMLDIEYTASNGGGLKGEHIHYVGDYTARLVGVNHDNYRVAKVGDRISLGGGGTKTITNDDLRESFSIEKREIIVTIKDQTLVYGSAYAREVDPDGNDVNIYNYVNASAAYTITKGEGATGDALARGDLASRIFRLRVRYDLEDGCNYLSAGTHKIYGQDLEDVDGADKSVARNYHITFRRSGTSSTEANLTITKATFTIDELEFESIFFDTKSHSPLERPASKLGYTFAGDTDYVFDNRTIYLNADENATVNDAGTGEWLEVGKNGELKYRNAGIHRLAIMIDAPNHVVQVEKMTFTIRAVNVLIDIEKQAQKTYGERIGDGSAKALSNFIIDETGMKFTVTVDKDEDGDGKDDAWTAISKETLRNVLTFYVVKGGSAAGGNVSVDAGDFANDVDEYRVFHKLSSTEANNYIVTYVQRNGVGCNAKAYKINKRKVDIEWYICKIGINDPDHECDLEATTDENGDTYYKLVEDENHIMVEDGYKHTYNDSIIGLRAKFTAIRYNAEKQDMEKYDFLALVVDGADQEDVRTQAYVADVAVGIRSTIDNYSFNENTTSFNYYITQREIKVFLKNQSSTYGLNVIDDFDDSDAQWFVDPEDSEWAAGIPDADMTLEVRLPQGVTFVPQGTYDIVAECGNGNFKVLFYPENGTEQGNGKFVVNGARIGNLPNDMDDLVYNGSAQNVDIWTHVNEHTNTSNLLVGAMTWADATVTYGYVVGQNEDGSDIYEYTDKMYQVTDATKEGDEPLRIRFKVSVPNHVDRIYTMRVTVQKATVYFNVNKIVEIQYGSTPLTSDQLFEQMGITVDTENSSALAVDLKKLVTLEVTGIDENRYIGHYSISATKYDNSNMTVLNYGEEIGDETATPYHIVERVITVNWGVEKGNTIRVYNGEEQYFKADQEDPYNNLKSGDTLAPATYSVIAIDGEPVDETTGKGKVVGKYLVKIVITSNIGINRNYVVDESCSYQEFEIVKKELRLTWRNDETSWDGRYDGKEHMLTPSIVRSSICDADLLEDIRLIPGAAVTQAKTHIASATVDEESSEVSRNYYVPESQWTTFEIKPKEVDIVWIAENFIYDGQPHCIGATVSQDSLIGDDTCEVEVSGGGIDAGTHRAVVTKLLNSNYTLKKGGAGQEFSIAKRVIKSVSWSNTSLTYQEINGIGQSQLPVATVLDGYVQGDEVEFIILVSEGEAVNVGTYTATIFGIKGGNYDWLSITNPTTTFTIGKADNSFESEVELPTPDGGLPALADFASVTAKYGKATVKYYTDAEYKNEYTGDIDKASKGTYYVRVIVEGTDNYGEVSKDFTVEVTGGSSNVGLIVGIIAGVVALAAIAIVLIIVLKKKKGNKNVA